jgi:post-segregation antitoxin (ccd killing protein)
MSRKPIGKGRHVIYVNLSADTDKYVREMARDSGMTISAVCDAIFRSARDRGLRISQAVTVAEGAGNDAA